MNKKRLVVHLSGFGEFQGVECNPTEDLVKQIPIYLEAMPIDVCFFVLYLTSV